jgi:hypothetical protein
MDIKEKLLKDTYQREAPLSMDVTKVIVDTRSPTHDVVKVYVRMMPAGQLVTDKTDSITLARRLIPDTLRYEKEPATLVGDYDQLAAAFLELMIEAGAAVKTGQLTSLSTFLKKAHAEGMDFVADFQRRMADRAPRDEAVRAQLDQPQSVPLSD